MYKRWSIYAIITVLTVVLVAFGIALYKGIAEPYYFKIGSRVYSKPLNLVMSHDFDALQLSGKEVKIGVLDSGFGGFETNKWLQNMNVVNYKNFVENDTTNFFKDKEDHGTIVCANIGGRIGADTIRGLAYNAKYYLAKVDIADEEPRADEQRVIKGLKWLLEQNVDVITASVYFTTFDDFEEYTPAMLDGKSSRISHFVDSILRVRPNLVFVQCAGNEGGKGWNYISFPGDIKEVITVGSCDESGEKKYHSSGIGREECNYVKPDLVMDAHPIGTSFSTPTITGLCAAILEYRKIRRTSLISILHQSGSNFNSPNRKNGYGIPKTKEIVKLLDDEYL